jgi:hypothetical protein
MEFRPTFYETCQASVYAECGLSPTGSPIENFLFINRPVGLPEDIGISPLEAMLIEWRGGLFVFYWLSSELYPTPGDFVAEVRKQGMSVLLPAGCDCGLLSLDSGIIVVHSKAGGVEPDHEPMIFAKFPITYLAVKGPQAEQYAVSIREAQRFVEPERRLEIVV